MGSWFTWDGISIDGANQVRRARARYLLFVADAALSATESDPAWLGDVAEMSLIESPRCRWLYDRRAKFARKAVA